MKIKAVIKGIIDYVSTIPPKISAKKYRGGIMTCGIQCTWDGQFDINSGNKTEPARQKISTYNTTVEEGKVFLLL